MTVDKEAAPLSFFAKGFALLRQRGAFRSQTPRTAAFPGKTLYQSLHDQGRNRRGGPCRDAKADIRAARGEIDGLAQRCGANQRWEDQHGKEIGWFGSAPTGWWQQRSAHGRSARGT